MNSKKPRLFLWISLSFVALSFVTLLVKIALLYCEFKATSSTLSPNDLIHFEYGFVLELFAYVLFGIPALLLELCGFFTDRTKWADLAGSRERDL